ncbi:hypothetical protein [Robertmurraya sp. FSL R5-0851]|uniref:hypothetical protein n=1 Tax=Robertmurraya sp. FSL R5-0851 TaxID=2921584 RepID=UPI004046DA2F
MKKQFYKRLMTWNTDLERGCQDDSYIYLQVRKYGNASNVCKHSPRTCEGESQCCGIGSRFNECHFNK